MGHVYFVRHGQTVWNVENKICGATDIELTELGHQQAVDTGDVYKRQILLKVFYWERKYHLWFCFKLRKKMRL